MPPADSETLMLPKHSAVYRQLQAYGEIILAIKQHKSVVHTHILETYQQNAAAIFGADVQRFLDNVGQQFDSLKGA